MSTTVVYVHSSKDIPRGEITHEAHKRFARYAGKTPDIDEQGNIDRTGTRWRDSLPETANVGPGQTPQLCAPAPDDPQRIRAVSRAADLGGISQRQEVHRALG